MIADSMDQTYAAGFEPSAYPEDPSLDVAAAPGVAPASYAEEFGGAGSAFDQPGVSDPSFQPQLADTPNPTSSISPWAIAAGIGLIFLAFGSKHGR